MSDLKNITINELPFQENLDDTSILHVSDGQDKQSTLARVWEWAKLKVSFTTSPKLKNILLSTSDQKLERIPIESFLQGSLGGLLNALEPIQAEVLLREGFSELEIFTYRVARKSALRELGEYFYMDIQNNGLLHELATSLPAQEYLLTYGISLANGENGSRDARGVFLRSADLGAGRESEERQIGVLQEDAFQGFGMGTYYDDSGKVDPPYIMISGSRNYAMQHVSKVNFTNITGTRTTSLTKLLKPIINDGEHGDPRIASETRPKNITAVLFQKVKDINWRDIPAIPPHFIQEEKY